MVTQSWMYDAILYIYALSLLFYFSDFTGANQRAKRMGTGLLVFVWVLQTVYLVWNLYKQALPQVFSMFDALFLLSWLLVGGSLLITRFFRLELFVFLVNVIGFAVLALNMFSRPHVSPLLRSWGISDELLFIHTSLAIGSYAAFVIGAVFSGMYVFLHRQLKVKHWTVTMKRLPSLEKTDRYAFYAIIAGVPLLILSLSLGIIWVVLKGNLTLLMDWKVIGSLIVLAVYLLYLVMRLSWKSSGIQLALCSMGGIGIVIINFVISNWLSSFHR